jgi:hypothetical protein
MTGGLPSAQFPAPGTTVSGRVVRIGEPMQQRDMKDHQPKTWDDGQPMMMLPVDVATEQRDPTVPDDDGVRCIYIRGQMLKSIRTAVRAAGARGLELGGILSVTYVRDGISKQRGFNPPKEYAATYIPPAAVAANDFLAAGRADEGSPGSDCPTPAVPAPTAIPAALATDSARRARPDVPNGNDALVAALANLTPEQRAALAALGG